MLPGCLFCFFNPDKLIILFFMFAIMPLKYSILILALLFSMGSIAQQKQKKQPKVKEEKKKKEKTPPENIEFFPKNFLVRVKFIYPLVSVNVTNRSGGKGSKFVYLPAMPGVVGLALKIKRIYISGGIELPASEELKKKYGISKFRNININFQGRIIQWGLFYRDYDGFYLNTYKNYYPNWNQDSLGYPKTKGLRIIEAGLNLLFNFNKKFSMNAAFAQGERQKKSAGSFLMGFSERYQRINSDTSFVPPTQGEFYPNLDKFKYGNFLTTLISVGFGYQFVMKKFHFTPVVMTGTGVQFQNYAQTHKSRFRINIPTYASARAQLGYNGDHFFTNIIYMTEFNTIPIKESRIRLFHNWFEVGAGMRF